MQPLTFQEKQKLAHNPDIELFIRFLNQCKTPIAAMIGEDQFQTVVNSITMERQAELIFNFQTTLEGIKNHKIIDDGE